MLAPSFFAGALVNSVAFVLSRWAPFAVVAGASAIAAAGIAAAPIVFFRAAAAALLECPDADDAHRPDSRCTMLPCPDCTARMTFDDFITAVGRARAREPHWRKGQAAFNTLYLLRPWMADSVRGRVGLDPFYVDEHLAQFYGHVRKRWDWDTEPGDTAILEGAHARLLRDSGARYSLDDVLRDTRWQEFG